MVNRKRKSISLSASKCGRLPSWKITAIEKMVIALVQNESVIPRLDSMAVLPVEVACAIAGCGRGVDLQGVRSLPKDAARALADVHGWVDLSGLSALPEDVAVALASSEERRKRVLVLSGLKQLNEGVADALAGYRGALILNGLSSLDPADARALAGHRGRLALNGIARLTPTLARLLARHKGALELNGVTSLGDRTAAALKKHHGLLSMTGLRKMTAAVIDLLGKSSTSCVFPAVDRLDEDAARCLAALPKVFFFPRLKPSAAVAKILGQRYRNHELLARAKNHRPDDALDVDHPDADPLGFLHD